MLRRSGYSGQTSSERARGEGEFVHNIPHITGVSFGNKMEGRGINRDGRRLPDLFQEDIGILFLMAFIFPKKHEAKSAIMREGTERGWLWDFQAE